jgi:hypothetical protein
MLLKPALSICVLFHAAFRLGLNIVDSKVSAHNFFLFSEANANSLLKDAINDETANQGVPATDNRTDELG